MLSRAKGSSLLLFDEALIYPAHQKIEEIPYNNIKYSYYIMRQIEQSMITGAYLTESLFIPNQIWKQYDIKFSGLSAKTVAFQHVHALLGDIHFLTLNNTSISLFKMQELLDHTLNEFNLIQNQLSKPFPFIPEIKLEVESIDDSPTKAQV